MSSSMDKEQTSGETVTETGPLVITESDPVDENLQLIVDKDCFTLNSNFVDVIDVDNESDDVEIIENVEQPIVIDDDVECVEVAEIKSKSRKEKEALLLEEVFNENILLSRIIEECINLDNSGSMKRIINKTLIPLYINCNVIYKNSEEFQSSLKRTLNLLETAPHLKFSHLKSLCELLKYDYVKKKLPLLTQRDVRKKIGKKRRVNPITLVKRRKENVVDLSQEWEVAEKDDDVIVISDHVNYVPYRNDNTMNTNERTSKNNTNNRNSTHNVRNPNRNKENVINNKTQNNSENRTISLESSQELLKPSHSIEVPLETAESIRDKVKVLENEIKELKKELVVLEEMEVTSDDYSSPYLRCEVIKEKIVKNYKTICLLMGTEPTKRHAVKLQVSAGHPEGPAKCLENYINNNIDENGNPPFPDIFDVVDCVEEADKIYKLNWNRKQIVQEAESLLKIYGKALQKRRMKREWRDMRSLCKEEIIDPADLDPELEARLLENRRIGIKNEEELLNRYAQLERETSNTEFSLTVENDDESDSEHEIDHRPSLHRNIVNNTNVDIVNNIFLDMVNDTGVDVVNTRRNAVITNCVNNAIDINGSPNAFNNTDVVNSNSVTINNIISNVVDSLIGINPNIVNNTGLIIVNNISPNTVNTNSVTVNNTINNSCDVVNNTNVNIVNNPRINTVDNTSQNVVDNTVTSTINIDNENKNIAEDNFFNTKINTEELLSTVTNVVPIILFDEPESPNKETEDTHSNSTKVDNIEFNRTIIFEEEISDKDILESSKLSADKLSDGSLTGTDLAENCLPSINKLPDSILNTDNLPDDSELTSDKLSDGSITRTDLLEKYVPGIYKLPDSILNTDNVLEGSKICSDKLSDGSISKTDLLENYVPSTDKLPDSILNADNVLEGSKISSDKLSDGSISRTDLLENYVPSTDKLPDSILNADNVLEGSKISSDKLSDGSISRTDLLENYVPSTDKLPDSILNADNHPEDSIADSDNKQGNSSMLQDFELEVKVKQEREDVTKLLDELGNDFTTKVFDIEDPFLVIDISDSSDSEDEDMTDNL